CSEASEVTKLDCERQSANDDTIIRLHEKVHCRPVADTVHISRLSIETLKMAPIIEQSLTAIAVTVGLLRNPGGDRNFNWATSAIGAIDIMQHLEIIDYFGVLAVWCSFFSIIFIISNTCIRICCIHKEDEHASPSLEKIASQQNFEDYFLPDPHRSSSNS
ncbi:hypothetical protein GCK32_011654, partial [Trichostrongylus colubriformis]